MGFLSKRLSGGQRNGRIGVTSTGGVVMALVAIVEALVLIFHSHQCPPGWAQFDFDAPIGTASLIVTVPLMIVALSSALAGLGLGSGVVRRVAQRVALSSLAAAVALTSAATGIALVLGWGVISNLGSSTNGCLTF